MHKLKRKFKAVIFDMDGVITNTMPSHFDAWMATLGKAGIKVNCYDIYKREWQEGLSTLRDLSRERGIKFNLRQAKEILAEKERLFKRIVKIGFIRGSRPFVRYLKHNKIKMGLVTGTSRHEAKRIMPKSLWRLFDVHVTGSDCEKGKPHPEPFLKALAALKIYPKDAVVIENAPFGIQAAKRAGIFCVALETSLPLNYLKGADMHIKSFIELRKLLKL